MLDLSTESRFVDKSAGLCKFDSKGGVGTGDWDVIASSSSTAVSASLYPGRMWILSSGRAGDPVNSVDRSSRGRHEFSKKKRNE